MTEPAPEQIKDLHVAIVKFRDLKLILIGFIRYYIGCRNIDAAKAYLGFTLAEVLITLSIIGVVAALTIPSLVVKNQEKETVVRVQKNFAVFSEAFSVAMAEKGPMEGWGIEGASRDELTEKFFASITPYLNTIKACSRNPGCFPDAPYQGFDGISGLPSVFNTNAAYAKAILGDGTLLALISGCKDHFCGGGLYFDVNGYKAPNQMGKDTFFLGVSAEGRVVMPEASEDSLQRCQTIGDSCSVWVILKKNLDYMNKEVTWN